MNRFIWHATISFLLISIFLMVDARAANLLRNPSFESDGLMPGTLEAWDAAGDRSVRQSLTWEPLPDGGRAARLVCDAIERKGPASHVMIKQDGVLLRKNQTYRLSFRACGESIADGAVRVRIQDSSLGKALGLDVMFLPTREWQEQVFHFTATDNGTPRTRLQLWFYSTGSLWLDDAVLEELPPDYRAPGFVIAPGSAANLLRNGSFECGTGGWGSIQAGSPHWTALMSGLHGDLDSAVAYHGQYSLRIRVEPGVSPVALISYPAPLLQEIKAPLAANIGFMQVEPGQPYTFSAFMKSDVPGTIARLCVTEFDGKGFDRGIPLTMEWKRFTLAFTPRTRWCFASAGPDLDPKEGRPSPPHAATVWLDALQLEQAQEPTPFQPRQTIEWDLAGTASQRVFHWDETIRISLMAANHGSDPVQASFQCTLRDDAGDDLGSTMLEAQLEPGIPWRGEAVFSPDPGLRGVLRLHVQRDGESNAEDHTARLAVIPVLPPGDTRFGINHPYAWPHLRALAKRAGITWIRDWAPHWQTVEPVKGQVSFDILDAHIRLLAGEGSSLLGLMPYPSAQWVAGAPSSVPVSDIPSRMISRMSYAPRDTRAFEEHVKRMTGRYGDAISWWQVFNEPLWGSDALPRKSGYASSDYARLVGCFAASARAAQPDTRVLAGLGSLEADEIWPLTEAFFQEGGLASADAIDIHAYPRLRPPEYLEPLLVRLNALMDANGGRKPLWMTEFGYYADDEPPRLPMEYLNHNQPLPSERMQAAFTARAMAILFANGVDRLFLHAGIAPGLNTDSIQNPLFRHAGEPRSLYATQAVMAWLYTPSCQHLRKLRAPDGVRAECFQDGQRLFSVVWTEAPGTGVAEWSMRHDALLLMDIGGRLMPSRSFTPSDEPVYVIADGLSLVEYDAALAR